LPHDPQLMNNREQLPRGETIPSIFQTIRWLKDPLNYLEYCQQKYGDVFTMEMGPLFSPQVLISDPQIIKQIYRLWQRSKSEF
jgi:cytochrome P450 family 110